MHSGARAPVDLQFADEVGAGAALVVDGTTVPVACVVVGRPVVLVAAGATLLAFAALVVDGKTGPVACVVVERPVVLVAAGAARLAVSSRQVSLFLPPTSKKLCPFQSPTC